MSKYIGTPVVNISADTVDVTGDITTTDATPEVIIVNDTHEDTDGGREGKVTFKGQQSGGEETTLAQIQASHDGTSDDEKGDLIFKTNDGSDGSSPTERMRIDSGGTVNITSPSNARALKMQNGANNSASQITFLSDDGTEDSFIRNQSSSSAVDTLSLGTGGSERMRIDSLGNVGIGVTPKTGGSTWQHVQFGGTGNIIARQSDSTVDVIFANNYYINSSDQDSYITTGDAARMFFNDDVITFSNAGSGSADAALTFVERMRIDSDGNVGIGIAPRTKLDIFGTGAGNARVLIEGEGGADPYINFLANNAQHFSIGIDDSDSDKFKISKNSALGTNDFFTLDVNGNVGIGLSASLSGLNVNGSVRSQNSSSHISYHGFTAYTGTSTAGGMFSYMGGDGRNTGFLNFATNDTERVRIDSSGNFLIGTTTLPDGSADGIGLRADSGIRNFSRGSTAARFQLQFMNPNGAVGRVETNGSATLYATSSDYRLKENVTDVTDGITRVKQLQPKRFNFIADADTTVDGFLAHEAATVVPESVSGEKDAVTEEVLYVDGDEIPEGKKVGDVKTPSKIQPQSIDQSKLVPLLTAALQEAIAKIETLETKVAALEGE